MRAEGLKHHLASAIREFWVGAVRDSIKEGGKEVVGKIVKKLFTEHRGLLFQFIGSMKNKMASENLMAFYRQYRQDFPNKENTCVDVLTHLYLAVKDHPEKRHIFEALGTGDYEGFKDVVSFLEHDVIQQALRQIGEYVTGTLCWGEGLIEGADERLAPLAEMARQMSEKTKKKGGFTR